MVLTISYENNPWGTISSCTLLGGIISTSINQRAYCNVGSNSLLYIVNVGGFMADPLLASNTAYRVKISFVSTGLTNTPNNNDFHFYTVLYANYDAYANGYQPIFNAYNWLISTTSLCYYSDPSNCIISQSSGQIGTFQVQAITDTFMRVAFSPNVYLNFGTNTGYSQYFLISLNGFDYGPSCTINNVVYEFSSTATPGSGTNNTLPPTSTTCNNNYIQIVLSGTTFGNYWGNSGGGNDWSPGQYIILYITIAPDPNNRDLPSFHHDYLFIQGSYSYKYSGTYYARTQGSVTYPAQSLAASATISTLTNNVGGVTEFSFQISNAAIDYGPQNTGYTLLAEFLTTSGWTGSNDPFASYTNTALLNDNLTCMCVIGATPLTVSAASPFVTTSCTRRMPNGTINNYAILIQANVLKTQDLICFFP